MVYNVTYIVDDQDESVTYLCPVMKERVLVSYYKNTWTTIESLSCGAGWFTYSFNGTSVRISAPALYPNNKYAVQIDGSPLLSQSGQGTYQSPVLADGVEHTITYAIGNQSLLPAFDYLTVTAGPSTPMYGRTVIVDDADSVLEYTGGWMTAPPMALPFDYSTSPYLETTHWSNMAGASISFPFTGDSIAVYGVIANTVPDSGNVTTTYTVGGKSTTLSLPTGSRQPIPMSEMFQTNLTAGQHTLLINITSVSAGQYIGFDFLTYNTTFDSISSISSSVPSESATPGTSNSHSKQVGAIAGGVIGGVAFFGVILLLLFLWRRRIRSKSSTSGWLNLGGSDSLSKGKISDDPFTLPELHKH